MPFVYITIPVYKILIIWKQRTNVMKIQAFHTYIQIWYWWLLTHFFWWWPRFEPRTLHILRTVPTNSAYLKLVFYSYGKKL